MSDKQLVDRNGTPFSVKAQDSHYFAASREAREFRHWNPPGSSADASILYETEALQARALDLARNNGVAAGAIRTKVDNVVGNGFRLSSKPDYKALGKTPEWAFEWAKEVESLWRSYAETKEFDAARTQTFSSMSALVLRTLLVSGEFLALPLWIPGRVRTPWSTALQLVDPARLSNPNGGMDGPYLRGGVHLDRYGGPTAYSIKRTHPGDAFLNAVIRPDDWRTIPARTRSGRLRVLHGFEATREGQHRGATVLAPVIGAFKMLDQYQRTELQTCIVNAMIAAFVETPMSDVAIAELFGSAAEYVDARSEHEVKLEGASVIPLYPGDKATAFTPARPGTSYAPFVESVLRHISTGLNLPYELLMKDFSKTNYSSARAALLEAWRYFNSLRGWMSTHWCNPVYELWLEEAVDQGLVEAPDFVENRSAYTRAQWIGPGRGWIDPTKEAQAAQLRLELNLSTLERECAEQGLDWEEVLEQRAREKAMLEQLGLSMSEEEIREEVEKEAAVAAAPEDEGDETKEGETEDE